MYLFFVLFLLLKSNIGIEHHCIHDTIDHDHVKVHQTYHNHPHTKSQTMRRKLVDEVYDNNYKTRDVRTILQPIRIQPDWFELEESSFPEDDKNRIKKLVSSAVDYFQSRVKIVPIIGPLYLKANSKCNALNTTYERPIYMWNLRSTAIYPDHPFTPITPNGNLNGIVNTDLFIVIRMSNEKTCTELPTSGFSRLCQNDQFGRPIHGELTICNKLVVQSRTHWMFAANAILHELAHIVFFDLHTMANFVNSKGDRIEAKYRPLEASGGNTFLRSKELTIHYRKYYNCNKPIPGIPLDNHNKQRTSHYKFEFFVDELMTKVVSSRVQKFSAFSFKLMEDSGWYFVNSEEAEPYWFGYQKTCNFFKKQCGDKSRECIENGEKCTDNYDAIGSCQKQTDKCTFPLAKPWSKRREICAYPEEYLAGEPNIANWGKDPSLSKDGYNSRCLNTKFDGGFSGATCWRIKCTNYNGRFDHIKLSFQGKDELCTVSDGEKGVWKFNNQIQCPNVLRACGLWENWSRCKVGYVTQNGKCKCRVGFTGDTCQYKYTNIKKQYEFSLPNKDLFIRYISVKSSRIFLIGEWIDIGNGESNDAQRPQFLPFNIFRIEFEDKTKITTHYLYFDAFERTWYISKDYKQRKDFVLKCVFQKDVGDGKILNDVNFFLPEYCNGLWADPDGEIDLIEFIQEPAENTNNLNLLDPSTWNFWVYLALILVLCSWSCCLFIIIYFKCFKVRKYGKLSAIPINESDKKSDL